MPAARVTAKTKIFELDVVLEEVQPLVRRRVQVPGEVSLAMLHEVVQSVVGWTNSHLHEFEIAGRRYGMPDPDWGDQNVIDEAKDKLFRLVGRGDRFTYVYDFGDNWNHQITAEKILPPEPGACYPRCYPGRGPAPRRMSAALGATTNSRLCWPTRRIPNTPSDSTGWAGRSTRPVSTSTTPIEPFGGWPGARLPRPPSASASSPTP
jgi:hypothetical protein